ncbi:hypothetical protein KW807_01280 [Candidatus Parcubacteria bacterium]|nr:hypothetical protein [Candidatus Parcubacteria bacterium]
MDLHHAYLLVGGSKEAEEFLHSFWNERGVKLVGSPDFFSYSLPLFGIDDARKLNEQAVRKAFTGQKVFFISPEKILFEAQNALLKTFEDPIEDTHFFLVTRDEELILPTLRSRMMTLRVSGKDESHDAEKFLNLSIKDRMAFIKKFVDKEENLSIFLDKLLLVSKSKPVYNMRRFSDDRAASPRLILEHLALNL